jgi:hypothetical protein
LLKPSKKIMIPLTTVIIKDVEQIITGLRAVNAMIQDGQRVRVLLLLEDGLPSKPFHPDVLKGFIQVGAECFTSSPTTANVPGFHHATVETMAEMLKETDFVVPFP